VGYAAEFVDTAREEAHHALRRALEALPVVPRVPPPHALPRLRAELVRAESGEVAEPSVRGRSFGLAMVLAAAARILDRPMPTELLATARVDDAGAVGHVDDIDQKTDFVIEYALGITRVMVHTSQAPRVRELLAAAAREGRLHGREVAVEDVDTVRGAIGKVFPEIEAELVHRWSNSREADAAARALLGDLIRGDRHANNWDGVIRAAELLAPRVSDESRGQTEWIRFIAKRHSGAVDALLPWPDAAALDREPPDARWLALSQVLQSAADFTDDDRIVSEYLSRAAEHANAYAESCPDGRRFLGAQGRALAAVNRCDEAAECLDATVAGWFRGSERDIPDASFALSELLRLRGFIGDEGAVDRALAWADRFEDHASASGITHGLAYVRHARARCHALRGRHDAALALLRAPTNGDLEPARRRWLARALDALGDTVRADEVRATLGEHDGVAWREATALAALDRALTHSKDHHLAHRAFNATGAVGAELRRMLRQRGLAANTWDSETAREIADRFRY
jgi:hypothetical protein